MPVNEIADLRRADVAAELSAPSSRRTETSILAEPRSAYLMSGPARSDWQHSWPLSRGGRPPLASMRARSRPTARLLTPAGWAGLLAFALLLAAALAFIVLSPPLGA